MKNLSKGLCLLVVATSLQCVTSNLPEFDASNVTEMQFTFRGVPGRDGRDGLVGPQGGEGPMGPRGNIGPPGECKHMLYICMVCSKKVAREVLNDSALIRPLSAGPAGLPGPEGVEGQTGPQGSIGPSGELAIVLALAYYRVVKVCLPHT